MTVCMNGVQKQSVWLLRWQGFHLLALWGCSPWDPGHMERLHVGIWLTAPHKSQPALTARNVSLLALVPSFKLNGGDTHYSCGALLKQQMCEQNKWCRCFKPLNFRVAFYMATDNWNISLWHPMIRPTNIASVLGKSEHTNRAHTRSARWFIRRKKKP